MEPALAIAAGLYLIWRLYEILQGLLIASFLAVVLAPPVARLS
jgi:predicted PurR-regulated permease PerM